MIYTQKTGPSKVVTIIGLGGGDVFLRLFRPEGDSSYGIAFITRYRTVNDPPVQLSWWGRFRRSNVGIGIFGPVPRSTYVSDRREVCDADPGVVHPADVEIQFQDTTALAVLIEQLTMLHGVMEYDLTQENGLSQKDDEQSGLDFVMIDSREAPSGEDDPVALQDWQQEKASNPFLFPGTDRDHRNGAPSGDDYNPIPS